MVLPKFLPPALVLQSVSGPRTKPLPPTQMSSHSGNATVAESIKSGELVPLRQDFQPPPIPVSLVYSPYRFMPVKLRAFLDFALPRLRARLGDLPKSIVPRKRISRRM
jgi:hypothetical protein